MKQFYLSQLSVAQKILLSGFYIRFILKSDAVQDRLGQMKTCISLSTVFSPRIGFACPMQWPSRKLTKFHLAFGLTVQQADGRFPLTFYLPCVSV